MKAPAFLSKLHNKESSTDSKLVFSVNTALTGKINNNVSGRFFHSLSVVFVSAVKIFTRGACSSMS